MSLSGPGGLVYPGWEPPARQYRHEDDPATKDGVVASRKWVSVYGADLTVDGEKIREGASVELSTAEGVRCGVGEYADSRLSFTPVYGFDGESEVTAAYPRSGEVIQVRIDGERVFPSPVWSAHGDRVRLEGLTRVADAVPGEFELTQNFPNPFNPATVIRFSLPEPGEVELAVFNILGRRVATLAEGVHEAGEHTVRWDGRDDEGNGVSSGVYLYRLKAGERSQTRKMLLVR